MMRCITYKVERITADTEARKTVLRTMYYVLRLSNDNEESKI